MNNFVKGANVNKYVVCQMIQKKNVTCDDLLKY